MKVFRVRVWVKPKNTLKTKEELRRFYFNCCLHVPFNYKKRPWVISRYSYSKEGKRSTP